MFHRVINEYPNQEWRSKVQTIEGLSVLDAITMMSKMGIDSNAPYVATAEYLSLDSFLYRFSDKIYEAKIGEIPENIGGRGYSVFGDDLRELFDIAITLNDDSPIEVYFVGHKDSKYGDSKRVCRDVTIEMEYDK